MLHVKLVQQAFTGLVFYKYKLLHNYRVDIFRSTLRSLIERIQEHCDTLKDWDSLIVNSLIFQNTSIL